MIRIVFSKKEIRNRLQRDFLENKKQDKINFFRKFLIRNKIYYPGNGTIFLSYAMNKNDIKKLITVMKRGLLEYAK